MDWFFKRTQQMIFFVVLLATAVSAALAYRQYHGEFITYHHAEKLFKQGNFNGAAELYAKARSQGLKAPEAARRLADSYLAGRNFFPSPAPL